MTFIDRSSKEFGTLIELASLDYWSSIGFIVDKEEQADDLLRFQKMLSTEDSAKVYCKYRNISSILYRQENPLFREWRCPVQLNEILSHQADEICSHRTVLLEQVHAMGSLRWPWQPSIWKLSLMFHARVPRLQERRRKEAPVDVAAESSKER